MKLKKYIQDEGLILNKFARKCGISYQRLYCILNGSDPSLEVVAKVEKLTGGKVTLRDFLSEEVLAELDKK